MAGSAATRGGPVTVALPMLTLVPGGMGGSETYARALTRELAGRPGLDVVSLVSTGGAGFSQGVPEEVVPGLSGGPSTRDRVRTLAQGTVRGRSVRRRLREADVVHYPFTVPVPRPPRGRPFVQSLLDVQHRDLPELFSRAELLYRSVFYDRVARRADAVITISEFAKERAVQHLGLDPDRVHVAHLGVDADEFTPNLGVREDFVLYPARGWAHKNHGRLVEAMERVRLRRPDLRLVLTGGALETLGDLPAWVDRRGLVSLEELLDLYRRAACLAFPSRYEGFGLPPLEAMASGCPVAAARSGSLPEVCGDAAVLFDADDPAAIAAGIEEALVHGEQLAERGLRQIRAFTWQRCADVHEGVYAELAARARPR